MKNIINQRGNDNESIQDNYQITQKNFSVSPMRTESSLGYVRSNIKFYLGI